jgi:hypothetical protein
MALALPKLRWLILGAIGAGVWVVHEDMKKPRPPERVPTRIERSAEAKPKPPKPVASVAKADKPAVAKPSSKATAESPVPPKPVMAKPSPQKTAPQKTAIALPKSVDRPPAKPQNIFTGSISRPDKPTFVQTKAKVYMRAQAKADAPIIATLRPRTVMRELARSGDWRLVMGDGRKGWVRTDYLGKPTFLPRRPKLPVAEVSQAKAPSKPAESR